MKCNHNKNSPNWALFLSHKKHTPIFKTTNSTMLTLIANVILSLICDYG